MRRGLAELGGWEHRPEVVERIVAANPYQSLYEAAPWMPGSGQGKTLLLHAAFDRVLGRQPTYRPQWRGTCVGRGGARVCDLLEAMQAAAGQTRWVAQCVAAGVYGGARVEIGGNKLRGDGAVVAYAVDCVTKIGTLLCEQYEAGGKMWDLRAGADDDDLCVKWGQSGIPDELEPLAARHRIRSWCPVSTAEECRDAVANGYPLIFGTSVAHWRTQLPAERDAKGFLRIAGRTAHCWIVTGVIDPLGALVLDNKSWGDDWVTGPQGDYPIGEGRYLLSYEDFVRTIREGECYALSQYDGFPPQNLDYLLI